MTRVVVYAESFKGRRHAALAVVDDSGKVIVNTRTGRSLCGVPVHRFAVKFIPSTGPQSCRRCNLLGVQEQHAIEGRLTNA